MTYQTKCILIFDRHTDHQAAGEALIAAGMNGIEAQMYRNWNIDTKQIEFTDPETMAEAVEIIEQNRKRSK